MTTEVTATFSQLDLKLGGSAISQHLDRALSEIEVENNLYLPDAFSLRFTLSSLDDNLMEIPDKVMRDYLSQGTEVVISQRVNNSDLVILDGEVTSVGLEFSSTLPSGQVFAIVQGYDRSHRLHRDKKTRTFVQQSYSDIVGSVAEDTGLSASVDSTSGVFDYVIQSNQTDWEFLWQLARRVGYDLYVTGKQLCFKKRSDPKDDLTLQWGIDLVQFRTRSSLAFQIPKVTVRGWDSKAKQAIVGQAGIGDGIPKTEDIRKGGDQAKTAYGESVLMVVDHPVNTQAEADAVAKALSDEIAGEFVKAQGVTDQGMGQILPGKSIDIQGLGKRSGTYFVTATTHRFTGHQGYTTSFEVGGRRSMVMSEHLGGSSRSSAIPRVPGVVIGLVTNNNDEEENLSRVKVEFPWMGESVESDWARVASPGAGPDRGMQWLPEVGDEVLVAFEHGDIHRPYVLGGLWNREDAPPGGDDVVVADGKVNLRRIKSREGFTLDINDESGKQYFEISNPAQDSKITLRSEDKTVEILSNGDINITGAQGKITVEGNDLEIKSGTNLKLSASANVEISAGANLTMKGEAQASLEATGMMSVKGAQTSVAGDAMTEIKGGIVKIN